MALTFRWTGRSETELIANVRLRCYGAKAGDLPAFVERTTHDRFVDGDVVVAERDGKVVGTSTSLSFDAFVRGTALPCQGVAWVGTTRADRRRKVDGHGIASSVMHSMLDKARDRGQVLSALMPFRASFYEHFGFGVVERRGVWTIPLATLPRLDAGGWRHEEATDTAGLLDLYRAHAARGQAEIRTDAVGLAYWQRRDVERGFRFVEESDGVLQAACTIITEMVDGRTIGTTAMPVYRDDAALARMLGFFGTLRDQYSAVTIPLPVDEPLNWRLLERQMPHRPVDHPAAECALITRMQVRVLDHVRLIEALRVPMHLKGSAVVAIQETEGHEGRLRLDFEAGRCQATTTAQAADVELSDVTWAAVALGELTASQAHRAGVLSASPAALSLLNGFSVGPVPFCTDYF